MHKITNNTKARHQVKTLDQGLVFLDPGYELTASLERTYAVLVTKGRSLDVEIAAEDAQPGLRATEGAGEALEGAGGPQIDPPAGSGGAAEPTDRDGWVKLAESANIEVKKSWGINRIKAELEKIK